VTAQDKTAAGGIEDVLAAVRRRETTVRICIAGDLAAEAERLAAQIDLLDTVKRTSLADGAERAELAAQLDQLIAKMETAQVEFRFRGLGDKEFSDMAAAYPATEPNKRWNMDAMAPDLIARSCISHPMTLEQSRRLHDSLPEGSREQLFGAAWEASRGEVRIPTSRAASVTTPGSGAR
jgi:hypothetical protein